MVKRRKSRKGIGGRPRRFQVVEELQRKIDVYFDSCWEVDPVTGKKVQVEPYTITGLAIALDTTRQVLLDYQNDKRLKEFADTIKKAKIKVEQYAESQLFKGKNVAGVIFNMKNNYGWVDKTEQNHSGIIGTTEVPLDKIPDNSELSRLLKDK